MPFSAEVTPEGTRFRLFAPAATSILVAIDGIADPMALHADGTGWHELVTRAASAGSEYWYVLPDGKRVPDPASRFQPRDIPGGSEVIDPAAYTWTDEGWTGVPLGEAVLYELHVGTFTREGTFRAAAGKLDYLRDLGITAVELMVVSDFPGTRGWGYDVVLPFAPDSAYGRPEDLKAFVNAAHAHGIAVVFDVVYNHFGPEGNYMPQYFPQICSSQHETAWGKGFNFDEDGSGVVRSFFIENALYWMEEFHGDGLRLDASHMMKDNSSKHILDEIAERVREATAEREVLLILEDEENVAPRLKRGANGESTGFTAQWNHDMTHLFGAALGCTLPDRDPEQTATEELAKAIAFGYVLKASTETEHADSLREVPPTAYVAFTQTHDLIGNRIDALRISGVVADAPLRAATAIVLLMPQVPMLFMGQEWNASTRFPYFSDYHADLGEKIRKGRCAFLQQLENADEERMKQMPDPQDERTFREAQLKWEELTETPHVEMLERVRGLLQVRRKEVAPLLTGLRQSVGSYEVLHAGALVVRWRMETGRTLSLAANMTDAAQSVFPVEQGRQLWLEGTMPNESTLDAWTVRWTLG